MEPHLEVHAEFLHGLANLVEHHWHRALAELLTLLGIAFAQRLALLVGAAVDARQIENIDAFGVGLHDHTACDLVDVGALVSVDGRRLVVGGGHERLGEAVDLLAVVIEVVFAHNGGAIGLQYAGHRIAHRGPARAADVDRAGRVRGDEFQIERLAAQVIVLAESIALVEHLVHHCGRRCGVERDVDEAGTCHFDGGNAIGAIQCVGEQLGEITRFHAGFLRQLHGGVRRPVAVRAILGAHDGEFGGIREFLGRQSAGFTLGNKVIGNGEDQFL